MEQDSFADIPVVQSLTDQHRYDNKKQRDAPGCDAQPCCDDQRAIDVR